MRLLGVRNHEAKKIMKEKMKKGDQVLFYHSNCKVPGVYGTAVVHKEGYPDFTAWDSGHPYFDAKSKQDAPTWFMVDVEFKARLDHPVTLALLKYLAGQNDLPECVSYIGEQGHTAIKEMALVSRSLTPCLPFLGVQPVTSEAYETILLLAKTGGWDELVLPVRKAAAKKGAKPKTSPKSKGKRIQQSELVEEPTNGQQTTDSNPEQPKKRKRVASKSSKTSGGKTKLSSSRSSTELSELNDSQGLLPKEREEQPTRTESTSDDAGTTDHEPPKKQKRGASKNSTTSHGKIAIPSSRSSSELSDLLENIDTEIGTLEDRRLAVLVRGQKRLLSEEIASGRHPSVKPYRRSARLQTTSG
ncbi:hypothetical protein QFC22_001878 [Naganishia vaughanmartiniae]|uniref:Uncharacterized protein n=1 Tax=Naganishia vaughanmartiniae TaxID=1424756 RepID=A0ACC2XEJ2_9TREE|nr:hypothetical protein QFC22_001878 [Naganishia vaughanmartiniae]